MIWLYNQAEAEPMTANTRIQTVLEESIVEQLEGDWQMNMLHQLFTVLGKLTQHNLSYLESFSSRHRHH